MPSPRRSSSAKADRVAGGDKVEFGIYLPQLAADVDELTAKAKAAERLGFDSLWLYDHLYGPGAPDVVSYEAWILATTLLVRTDRLRVGHLVNCNNFRHPALLAKMAATLDVVSNGRLEFGLGSGSYEPEHVEAGLPWGDAKERTERFAEALEVIRLMFAGPRASFAGAHYQLNGLPTTPAPVQSPHPPIHIGGVGPTTRRLAATYADVWNIPTYALDRVSELMASVDEECERVGRDPATLQRSVEAVMVTATSDNLTKAIEVGERRYGGPGYGLAEGGFVGSPARIVDRIGELTEVGFTSFIFMTHDRAAPETLEVFAAEVMPAFRET
jgi:alkanesulfonate monooxygenase SsuD/methylene tetrahydromethanopterin reductase-like flavin-dependent oxidoreductase (luciferase family)